MPISPDPPRGQNNNSSFIYLINLEILIRPFIVIFLSCISEPYEPDIYFECAILPPDDHWNDECFGCSDLLVPGYDITSDSNTIEFQVDACLSNIDEAIFSIDGVNYHSTLSKQYSSCGNRSGACTNNGHYLYTVDLDTLLTFESDTTLFFQAALRSGERYWLSDVYDLTIQKCEDQYIDVCGVCGGDGTSCLDECSVPNGDNSSCTDNCGVVNGDNTTCGSIGYWPDFTVINQTDEVGNALSEYNENGGGCYSENLYKDIDINLVPIDNELSIYPNPTNSTASISFTCAQAAEINLFIIDEQNNIVSVLLYDQFKEAGYHTITWTPEIGPGYYRAIIEFGEEIECFNNIQIY